MDLPERQRTLRATVDWSVGLLDDAERAMLSTLAVFADGWTIEAATHVADLSEDRTLDLLEALVRHSLVHVDPTDHGPRFRMLETVREFAAERLATNPNLADVQRRHGIYFRDLAVRADRPLRGVKQGEWADRLQVEAANLSSAVRWFLTHEIEPLPHLFRVLWLFWALRDHLVEVRSWIDDFSPAVAALDDHARAEYFWAAAVTAVQVGDDTAALAAKERLEPLLRAIDDPFLEAIAHLAMAWILPSVDDLDGALREASLCREQLRDQDEPFWTASSIASLGGLELAVGRHDDALRHLTQVREQGEQFDTAWPTGAWAHLGTLAVMQGRLDDARAVLGEGLTMSLNAESTLGITLSLEALARLAFAEGTPDRAAVILGAAEGLRRRAGLQLWTRQRKGQAELVEQLEHALGTDRFGEAFNTGSGLSRREAVAMVLGRDNVDAGTS